MSLNAIARKYDTDKGTTHNYLTYYERHFSELRHKPITILELGIGGENNHLESSSLNMWHEYFPSAKIIGVDIYDKRYLKSPRIHIEMGDYTNKKFLKKLVKKYGPFDIIIDDASHKCNETLTALFYLIQHVSDDGYYVIEDMQTSYWSNYGGSSIATNLINTPASWAKHAVDIINYGEHLNQNFYPFKPGLKLNELHVYHNLIFLRIGTQQSSNVLVEPHKHNIKTYDEQCFADVQPYIEEFEQDRLAFLRKLIGKL